jgi:hypothetical protein
MISALVFLYLASESRLASLEKEVEFHSLPRENEWLKLRNRDKGDYFAFRVKEVTHREGGLPELMLDVLKYSETEYELFEEQELDEYISSYTEEGWLLKSCKENTRYINRADTRTE